MKTIKLDSILLFALVIPFIMTYRISPGDTPYWLFGLIFLALLLYIVLDLKIIVKTQKVIHTMKFIILWFTILVVIGSAFFSAIVVRHHTTPEYQVHDIILQQEAALKYFLHGKNPYRETYFGTPLEKWHYSDTEINPALYHFVMEPFYLLFAVPFYVGMGHTVGFFDARIPLVLLFGTLFIFARKLIKDPEESRLCIILLAFNPAMLGYVLEGRDDIFMYTFLFSGLYFLQKKKYILAGIPMALAFATKQSAWPIFPFYCAFLYYKNSYGSTFVMKNIFSREKFIAMLRCVWGVIRELQLFILTFFIIVLPFFFWDPQSFLQSTIFYLSGSDKHSYPVAGYGLGAMLHQFGFITDVHVYYPFWIWQAIFCLPVLVGLVLWFRKDPSVKKLLVSYGIFLLIFWYLSRYFNNSHLGYISMVFVSAYFWPEREENI